MKKLKVRCINKEGCFLLEKFHESMNGIYEASENDGDDVYAISFGRFGFMWFHKSRFEVIEEE